jgi:hypothetical protein
LRPPPSPPPSMHIVLNERFRNGVQSNILEDAGVLLQSRLCGRTACRLPPSPLQREKRACVLHGRSQFDVVDDSIPTGQPWQPGSGVCPVGKRMRNRARRHPGLFWRRGSDALCCASWCHRCRNTPTDCQPPSSIVA